MYRQEREHELLVYNNNQVELRRMLEGIIYAAIASGNASDVIKENFAEYQKKLADVQGKPGKHFHYPERGELISEQERVLIEIMGERAHVYATKPMIIEVINWSQPGMSADEVGVVDKDRIDAIQDRFSAAHSGS